MNPTELSDAELWQAFKEGSEPAYAYLYRKFTPSLYSYGYGICRDSQLVADSIQELFIYLYQRRQSLGEVRSIKAYLFSSLKRRMLDVLEQQAKHPVEKYLHEEYHFQAECSAEGAIIESQTLQRRNEYLQELVDSLPKRQREAVYLMYYDRMSHQEIASVMALEVKTVYNLLYEALQSLKRRAVSRDLLLLVSLLILC